MLNVSVFDTVYGGFSDELSGSVSVSLENKLPWSENYVAPQTEAFETPVVVDKAKLKAQERKLRGESGKGKNDEEDEEEEEEEEAKEEKEVESEDEDDKAGMSVMDSGLGAFNFESLKTSSQTWMLPEDSQQQTNEGKKKEKKKLLKEESLFGDTWFGAAEAEFDQEDGNLATKNDLPDPRELGIDIPDSWASKEWLEDRDFWIQQGGSGLEDYLKTSPFENYLLKKGCVKSNGASTVRVTGKFKGLISISETKNVEPLVPLERVADYVARIYVWKADSLQPSDPNGKADPYIKCSLGSWAASTRKEKQIATLSPEFYKTYDVPMKIPGESQLKVSVFDWDRFHLPGTSDTLIGETVIDLEDRYFHKKWKALGQGTPQALVGGPPKPIEARDLMVPESNNSQGKVYMWAEILPAGEARSRKTVTFERPPEMDIEVRVIVWALSGFSTDESSQDYFVKTYLKGEPRKKRETDTHWRSKTGAAQWNWRHKHTVSVPLDLPDKGDLVVELWDRDIFSSSDSLGSFTFPLSDWLKKCYIEQKSVKPFELIHDKQTGTEKGLAAVAHDAASELKDLESEAQGLNVEGDLGLELGLGNKAPQLLERSINPLQDVGFDDDAFDVDEVHTPGNSNGNNGDNGSGEDNEEDSSGEEDGQGEDAPLVKKSKEKKQKKPENIVDVLRELAGLPVAHDDAHWFDLGVMDVEDGQFSTNGQLYISVELVPFEFAESSPVGLGRAEPNTSPYLPPPAGRLSIGMDPCSILCALFAEYPGVVCCICACCCIILFMGLMMVGGTYISAFAALGL